MITKILGLMIYQRKHKRINIRNKLVIAQNNQLKKTKKVIVIPPYFLHYTIRSFLTLYKSKQT